MSYDCHATTSKLKFWGCNQVKFALDKCLKVEKERLLVKMNKDIEARSTAEEDVYQQALGTDISFEDYLKQDKDSSNPREERRKGEASLK